MFLVFNVVMLVAAVVIHLVIDKKTHRDARRVVELLLLYYVFFFFGLSQAMSGLGHIMQSDKLAAYIGWPAGNPFQKELGFASLGLAFVSIFCVWLRGRYFVAPVIGNAIFFFGVAQIHVREIAEKGNMNPGNAGPVLYADIFMPVIAIVLMITYFILSRRRS
jgi:hypothetical protein